MAPVHGKHYWLDSTCAWWLARTSPNRNDMQAALFALRAGRHWAECLGFLLLAATLCCEGGSFHCPDSASPCRDREALCCPREPGELADEVKNCPGRFPPEPALTSLDLAGQIRSRTPHGRATDDCRDGDAVLCLLAEPTLCPADWLSRWPEDLHPSSFITPQPRPPP